MADPERKPVSIRAMFNMPPERAIAYLDSKGYRISVDYTDTWNEEHDANFTVSKVAKLDILREVHVWLLDGQTTGETYEARAKEIIPKLQSLGWWGKVQDREVTGTDETVNVTPARLRRIWDTNMRMSRSAALWERVQASKATLPFLRYSAVLDRRTRPQHAAWHGVILPVDHPFWLTHFPPCGWNCRCTAIQLNESMMERRGWKVTEPAPPIVPVPFYNRSTGQTVQVPRGIDPGFGYNPGIARMQATADKVAASLVQARREGLMLDDAALADLLSELPPGRVTPAALTALQALIAAGEVAQLAAAVMGLLG
jgi:SPP1 gp7 family putative phage head morphogenesis protein